MRSAERRVRSRKLRPPGTKILCWLGRSAPADSVMLIDGSRFSAAISASRSVLATPYSLTAPPLTVESLAVIRHSTPETRPMPAMMLAPGVWPEIW